MKKGFFLVFLVVILLVTGYFLFFSSDYSVTVVMPIKCNVDGAGRVFSDTTGRDGWRPAVWLGSSRIRFIRPLRRGAVAAINMEGMVNRITFNVFPLVRIDSCVMQVEVTLEEGWDPVKRINGYWQARRIRTGLTLLLDSMRSYLENVRNVYGMDISEVSTNNGRQVEESDRIVGFFPRTDSIYTDVRKLEEFISRYGARKTGDPMVNIKPLPNGCYELRVAVPTDSVLSDRHGFRSKEVPARIKFLEAEVRGGDGAVQSAMYRMNTFIGDHRRTVMAIPFFTLVTDRRLEADTTKWVTKIDYPIF